MHVFYHTCNICMYESNESFAMQCMHVYLNVMKDVQCDSMHLIVGMYV